MAEFTIYHNPKCSKSRQALALLRENGIEPTIVEYLKTPLSAAELKALITRMGMKPSELVRKGEEIYKSKYADKTLTEDEWLQALVAYPSLLERPIVISGKRAVLGRPSENVSQLLRATK